MTDSPFGPVRKWGIPWTPEADDLELLAIEQRNLDFQRRLQANRDAIAAANTAAWERHVGSAIQASAPLSHPANLGQLDDSDIEPLDRGSSKALGNGLVAALLFAIAPFAIYGAYRLAWWVLS